MLLRNMKKEEIMDSIQMAEIEQYAGELRAQEMQRIAGLIGTAVGAGLVAFSELLRPLFSWNPQREKSTGTV